MEKDAAPSSCDVAGCPEPATGSYLHARDAEHLEFGICPEHHAHLQKGARPIVVSEGYDALHGRPMLVLGE